MILGVGGPGIEGVLRSSFTAVDNKLELDLRFGGLRDFDRGFLARVTGFLGTMMGACGVQ